MQVQVHMRDNLAGQRSHTCSMYYELLILGNRRNASDYIRLVFAISTTYYYYMCIPTCVLNISTYKNLFGRHFPTQQCHHQLTNMMSLCNRTPCLGLQAAGMEITISADYSRNANLV